MRTEAFSFLPLCLAAAGHFQNSEFELVQRYLLAVQNMEPTTTRPESLLCLHASSSLAWLLRMFSWRIRAVIHASSPVTSYSHSLFSPPRWYESFQRKLSLTPDQVYYWLVIRPSLNDRKTVFPTCPHPSIKQSCGITKYTFRLSCPSRITWCSALLVVCTCGANKIR